MRQHLKRHLIVGLGLVLWLPFNGDTQDYSGLGNHETTYGASWVDGKFGRALNFDGDDYALVPNAASLQIVGDLTVSFWLYANSLAAWADVINKPYTNEFCVNLGTNGTISLYHGNGVETETSAQSAAGAVSIGTWCHVVATRDNATKYGRIYINGALSGTPINYLLTPASSAEGVYMGKRFSGGGFVVGIIDEVQIYNRALSPTEIWDLYQRYL